MAPEIRIERKKACRAFFAILHFSVACIMCLITIGCLLLGIHFPTVLVASIAITIAIAFAYVGIQDLKPRCIVLFNEDGITLDLSYPEEITIRWNQINDIRIIYRPELSLEITYYDHNNEKYVKTISLTAAGYTKKDTDQLMHILHKDYNF